MPLWTHRWRYYMASARTLYSTPCGIGRSSTMNWGSSSRRSAPLLPAAYGRYCHNHSLCQSIECGNAFAAGHVWALVFRWHEESAASGMLTSSQ